SLNVDVSSFRSPNSSTTGVEATSRTAIVRVRECWNRDRMLFGVEGFRFELVQSGGSANDELVEQRLQLIRPRDDRIEPGLRFMRFGYRDVDSRLVLDGLRLRLL